MSQENLKNKAIKGISWSAFDNFFSYFVTFVVGLILARILKPDDYGLIGIITIFTAICQCFINAGFGNALIRKKDVSEDDYCTVFVINFSISILLYLFLFFSSPLIASFFHREELVSLIRVETLSLIINSLAIVQRTRLSKKIDFKSQAYVTIVSCSVKSVVGIVLAFSGFGVWAIVWQTISGAVTATTLLCYYNRWMPRLRFFSSSFRELFSFGSKLLVSDIISTIWTQLYSVVIGRYYTPATLGQYTRAKMFDGLLSVNLTVIVQRVTFPVLSELQDDKQRLKNGYRRAIRTIMLICFGGSLMMAAIAKPMIIVLVGPQWIEASQYLQIIIFGTMLFPLHIINLNMLMVLGRSDIYLKIEIYKKLIAIIPILIGIFIGIYWMLLVSVLVGIVHYYINAYYSGKLIDYYFLAQLKDIKPAFLISLVGSSASYICYRFAEKYIYLGYGFWQNLSIMLIIVFIGFAIMIFLLIRTHNQEFIEIKNIIRNIFIKVNHKK